MNIFSNYTKMRLRLGKDFADRTYGGALRARYGSFADIVLGKKFNQEMRKSYFTPEENLVKVKPQEDGEAMQEGVDVLKKRRGSIFGNNIGTIFGN